MIDTICRYGVPMIQPAKVKPESVKQEMTATEQPRMTEEDRKALLHALVDGKTCHLKYLNWLGEKIERQVKLSGMSILVLDGAEWCKFESPMSDWISWRKCVEPLVWEGKAVVVYDGEASRSVGIKLPQAKYGSMVSYRIEEIVE